MLFFSTRLSIVTSNSFNWINIQSNRIQIIESGIIKVRLDVIFRNITFALLIFRTPSNLARSVDRVCGMLQLA